MNKLEDLWDYAIIRALPPAIATVLGYIIGNYIYYLEWFPEYNEKYTSILCIAGGSIFSIASLILTKDNKDAFGITLIYSGLLCILFICLLFLGNVIQGL